jgi:hypothetical protein
VVNPIPGVTVVPHAKAGEVVWYEEPLPEWLALSNRNESRRSGPCLHRAGCAAARCGGSHGWSVAMQMERKSAM